jgi:hypothetical protein
MATIVLVHPCHGAFRPSKTSYLSTEGSGRSSAGIPELICLLPREGDVRSAVCRRVCG